MGIATTSGTKVSISTTSTAPSTYDASGYAALTFSEIGSVESVSGFGDESSEVTFDELGDGRTKKLKGQKNAGNMELMMGLDDEDAGQGYLYTAEADATTNDWHFKVEVPNSLGTANAVRYFSGKVMSVRETYDTANNVIKLNTTVGINTAIVRVDAT
jgi:hypothetical protein